MSRPWVPAVATHSTCQKRVTVCVIFDDHDQVLASESNRCAPAGGVCSRLTTSNTKNDYPLESCNWEHAEARAVEALPKAAKPYRAVLFGHDFYCDACEARLRAAGVQIFEIAGPLYGTGLRTQP